MFISVFFLSFSLFLFLIFIFISFLIIITFCRDILSVTFSLVFPSSFFLLSPPSLHFTSASLFCFSFVFYYFVVLKTTTEKYLCLSFSKQLLIYLFLLLTFKS
uniref:Uncharacterized protein n=1 Tax=Octopus bimaculoides TaxID=37653 RepID=A0A0L8FYJ3_OCTBM